MNLRVARTVVRRHCGQQGGMRLKPSWLNRDGGEGWQYHWPRSGSHCRLIEVVDVMSWAWRRGSKVRMIPDWIWSSGDALWMSDRRRRVRMMSYW